MKVIKYPAGVYQANCYIVYDEKTNDGFVIDPGGDAEDILAIIMKSNLNIKYIILTHGHFDHTGGVNNIKQKLNVPVYIHMMDNELITGQVSIFSRISPKSEPVIADGFLKDGDALEFGQEKLLIIETPGHSKGSITVKADGCLFTGDTLFLNSIGRTDFPGGSHEQLIKSIKEKLFVLADDTRVYPGHGPETTIGIEKEYNPFL